MFGKVKSIHFVGIGGIGMSGIAEVLCNLGFKISGSDLKSSSVTDHLTQLGVTFSLGHRLENIQGAELIVTSTAVHRDNPEVQAGVQLGIPIISRGEMLAELMRLKKGIAIAGSHGKTSTTSMVAQVLSEAGLDPTIVIGGKLAALGSNAKLGQGAYLVAEADESDGSFLMLRPYLAVITNIDREHMDHYPDLASIKEAFITFANSLPFYGRLYACQDDPHLASIFPRINRPIKTYSTEVPADLYATDIRQEGFDTYFKVHTREACLGDFSIRVPGTHMVANALAAIGIALELDLTSDKIRQILSSFRGADRRFTLRGEREGILVVDDYGHHPTEIQTTLKAARKGFPERRIVAAFQPHRFTRTQALMNEFISAFRDADLVFLTEIYPAGEKPIPGIEGKFLAEAIGKNGQKVHFVSEVQDLPQEFLKVVQPGDLLITFGAGSITQIGPKFLAL